MVCRREERRQLNLKVFQHAPCTIGIYVNRTMCRGTSIRVPSISTNNYSTQFSTTTTDLEAPEPVTLTGCLHQVVAIFFGGPDDREAASFMAHIARHPSVNATLVSFLPETQSGHINAWSLRCMREFSMTVDLNKEHELDELLESHFLVAYQQRYINNFVLSIWLYIIWLYNSCHEYSIMCRYVESEVVTYIERHVSSGPEIVTAFSSMAGSFTLFIVGKESPHLSALMMGVRDGEECPELGPIGDLLASGDIMNSGSVLILQQHKVFQNTSRSSR